MDLSGARSQELGDRSGRTEYSREELVQCLTREIKMQQSLYGRRVAMGEMRASVADKEIDMMDTIRHHIKNCNGLNGQMVLEEIGDRSKETGADKTANCPQRALALVIKAFDEGVEKYGDANDLNEEMFYTIQREAATRADDISFDHGNQERAIAYAKVAGWYMCLAELCARYAAEEADHD